jgi:hypothetical protein
LARGILVVAEKAPDGLAVVYTGAVVGSSVRLNAWEYTMRSAQSVAAPCGPTDPDRVTECPATTGVGLAWTTTAVLVVKVVAEAGAAATVSMAAVAANKSVAMVRTARMVISPGWREIDGAAPLGWRGLITAG